MRGARRFEGVDLVLITTLVGKSIPQLADFALEFRRFRVGGVGDVGRQPAHDKLLEEIDGGSCANPDESVFKR